ncbi:MAG TPA: cytochrome c [Magnetospirillaceae bacterium]|nr:cytochrome c [Magnetospirillaceae bacterium]
MSKIFASLALASLALSPLVASAADETGEALYAKKCAACHALTGQGQPALRPEVQPPIPPLAASGYLQDDPDRTATLILRGKAGMPAFHLFLSDDQISKILTYARGAWGNQSSPISPEVVAEARKKLGDDGFKMPSN